MTTPDWKLTLQSAAVDKAGKPRLACAYAVDTSLTDQRLNKLALPVFAPSAEELEFRAATDRDLVVNLSSMLKTLHDNKPSPYLAPNWQNHTVTLTVFRGLGTNLQLAALKHSTAFDARAAAKRGRDQASSKGKVTSQGQNSDK